jgi:hypothetical protein
MNAGMLIKARANDLLVDQNRRQPDPLSFTKCATHHGAIMTKSISSAAHRAPIQDPEPAPIPVDDPVPVEPPTPHPHPENS